MKIGETLSARCRKCYQPFDYVYKGGPRLNICLLCTTATSATKVKERRLESVIARAHKEPTYNVASWLLSRGVISPSDIDHTASEVLFGERARRAHGNDPVEYM